MMTADRNTSVACLKFVAVAFDEDVVSGLVQLKGGSGRSTRR